MTRGEALTLGTSLKACYELTPHPQCTVYSQYIYSTQTLLDRKEYDDDFQSCNRAGTNIETLNIGVAAPSGLELL